MVIPAGTSPDTMVMDKSAPIRRRQNKVSQLQNINFFQDSKPRFMYPDRNISTPEAIPGRQHSEIQTEEYFERLQDKPQSDKIGVATEFYLDRPPVPLF
jgi:hypothetical protein